MEEFIYLEIEGETASFKVPQVYQGFLISLPLPPYSTILGILSRITGREITPSDTRVGFQYTFEGVGKDLEKYHRWKRNNTGTYSYDKTAVRAREVHYKPRLRIVLDNVELMSELENPQRFISLGRSQDIAWIAELKYTAGEAQTKGVIKNTLVRLEDIGKNLIEGSLYNIPEYYDYTAPYVRSPINITRYLAVGNNQVEAEIPSLYTIDNTSFYLYRWGGK